MKKIKNYLVRVGIVAGTALAIGPVAYAQPNPFANPLSPSPGPAQPGTTGATPGITLNGGGDITSKILCPLFDLMFWVFMAVSIIMVLWGAYTYVTAGDDAEKPSKARKILTYAAIGIVVALIARGFPSFVGSLFGQGTGLQACAGF